MSLLWSSRWFLGICYKNKHLLFEFKSKFVKKEKVFCLMSAGTPNGSVNGEGGSWTHQRLGVVEDVVLQELVQHVEEVVLDQRLDDQLVQVMLTGSGRSHYRAAPTGTVEPKASALPGPWSGTGSRSGCTPSAQQWWIYGTRPAGNTSVLEKNRTWFWSASYRTELKVLVQVEDV